jgi:hypothetical protein
MIGRIALTHDPRPAKPAVSTRENDPAAQAKRSTLPVTLTNSFPYLL